MVDHERCDGLYISRASLACALISLFRRSLCKTEHHCTQQLVESVQGQSAACKLDVIVDVPVQNIYMWMEMERWNVWVSTPTALPTAPCINLRSPILFLASDMLSDALVDGQNSQMTLGKFPHRYKNMLHEPDVGSAVLGNHCSKGTPTLRCENIHPYSPNDTKKP